jgi:hypothetical protein
MSDIRSLRIAFVSALLATAGASRAQSNFSIDWYSIDCGGGSSSGMAPSGATFAAYASIGQYDAAQIAIGEGVDGVAFVLSGGFLPGAGDPTTPPCFADFNGDGLLNPDDLSEFITCFFLQLQFPGFCPSGDFNQDELLNPDDLSEFITIFFLSLQFGC